MKKYSFLGVLTILCMVFGLIRALPAHAEGDNLGVSIKASVNMDDQEENDAQGDDKSDKNDDKGDRGEDGVRSHGFLGAIMRQEKRTEEGKPNAGKFWSGIIGKITAVDGMKITVSSPTPWNKDSKTTVYTVDATNAKIIKGDVENSPASSLMIGDMIVAEGTVTGTNVSATVIHDGMWRPKWEGAKDTFESSGDPVVGGTVTAISNTTITIKNKAGITYTIDAGAAKFGPMNGTTHTLADIKVGNNLLVQGPVSNTSVTAKFVMDTSWKMGMMDDNGEDNDTENGDSGMHKGFFRGIGNFFGRWFHKS